MTNNYLLLLVFLLTVTSVSAWPYELYENNTFRDMNTSNTNNFTIVINEVINITNITNIYNVTNVTNVTNNLNGSFYNTTQTDARFLRQGEQYGNTEVFNRAELNVILNNLTTTDADHTAQLDKLDIPTGWIWGAICVAILMSTIALVMIGKDGNYQ